jgi:regulator of protease activity HflC (stomatin/prohibitin superfamily)
VVAVLLATAAAAAVGSLTAGRLLGNPVLLDAAVMLGIASGVLLGVALARMVRAGVLKSSPEAGPPAAPEISPAAAERVDQQTESSSSPKPAEAIDLRPSAVLASLRGWSPDASTIRYVGMGTAGFGVLGTLWVRQISPSFAQFVTVIPVSLAAAACLCAAGLAATAVRYLAPIDSSALPEGQGLGRGARIVAWTLSLAALSIGLQWFGQLGAIRAIDSIVAIVNLLFCFELFIAARAVREEEEIFPLNLDVLAMFGSRPNALGSLLDWAERRLGIDLRSSWALTVLRRSVEPLILGLCLLGWLTTSLTIVGLDEEGLVERFGVAVPGTLKPGIHVRWPWPIDSVARLPVQRVQELTVGHEGAEEGEVEGPEDVLWARQHAANEYTLLLGDGRDLITVDAAVQFRIVDARAWRYHSQNPADALRAIAHRAVMRTTVNRTLAEALSENLVAMTARMKSMVQDEANALDLGVEILGFTVGGMHPPVAVAPAYQAVVSAGLGKVTAVVDAQAYKNRTVPYAENAALLGTNGAKAEGEWALGRAAGEAWSFRTLQSQFQASPADYLFRRRLETLEKGLSTRRFTILDFRIQRDGGELWLTP